MNFNDYFIYNNGSIYWKKSRGRVSAGQKAGRLNPLGYRRVSIDGKEYYVHRVVWEMFNPKIEKGLEIDHINRKRDDNRLENLRLVTPSYNKLNMGLRSDSTTRVKGVYWSKQKQKWSAELYFNKKKKFLGYFDTFDKAVQARKVAESQTYNWSELATLI